MICLLSYIREPSNLKRGISRHKDICLKGKSSANPALHKWRHFDYDLVLDSIFYQKILRDSVFCFRMNNIGISDENDDLRFFVGKYTGVTSIEYGNMYNGKFVVRSARGHFY